MTRGTLFRFLIVSWRSLVLQVVETAAFPAQLRIPPRFLDPCIPYPWAPPPPLKADVIGRVLSQYTLYTPLFLLP